MDTNDISVKHERKQNRVLRKIAMFFVALLCCFIATTSSSWLTAKDVVAVGGIPIIVKAVTKEDIEDAKDKRDAALAAAEEASDMIDQLNDKKSDLEGELAKLNEANEAQREQYELIYSQLVAALEEKAKALDEFLEAQENLEAQQKLFTK